MQTPIKNPILSVQDPKKTNFSIFATNPSGPFKFEQYLEGPNKGFYKRIPAVVRDGKPLIYTKAYFPKPITGLYKNYLQLYKGFYYIPKSSLPIRRLIYGLEHYDIPSSGNMEEFFKQFYQISVPTTFCPLIDPCIYDWCKTCNQQHNNEMQIKKRIMENNQRKINTGNLFYLSLFIGIISMIIAGSFA